MSSRRVARSLLYSCAAFALLTAWAGGLRADDATPLHARIDALLDTHLTMAPAGPAPDGARVRRLYLDLTGAIPSAEETRAFLNDSSPDRWVQLVDQLLASEAFADHMANHLDVMLMERRADKHVKRPEWEAFLKSAIRSDQPFHEFAANILAADGRDAKERAPAKFYLEREAEPNLLTRDIGRVFFGLDLQCAQCHDHPLISDYYQSDYFGLYSFVSRLSLFADKKQKFSYLAEKSAGEVKFTSVFTSDEGRTNPRLPLGTEIGDDPQFDPGQEYQIPPSKEDGGVPKYSRREQLAKAVATGANPAFRRNIANRLWAFMMGRGLVHPLDLHHSENPPSHPELLAVLTDEIASMNFNTKAFLRELALTQAYQRSYSLPDDWLLQAKSPDVQANHMQWQRQRDAAAESLEAAEVKHASCLIAFSSAQHARELADEAVHKATADVAAKKTAYDKAAEPWNQRNATRASQQKTADLLQSALSSIAMSKVGEEAKPANDVIAQRHQGLVAELAKSAAELEKLAKAAEPAKQAWQAAQAAVAPARDKVTPLAATAQQAEAVLAVATHELRQWQRVHSEWSLKLEETAALMAAADAVQAADAADAAWQPVESEFQVVDAQRRPLAEKLEELQASAEKARTQRDQAAATLAKLEQSAMTAKRTEQLLAESLVSLEQAQTEEANPIQEMLTSRQTQFAEAAKQSVAALEQATAQHQAITDAATEADAQWKAAQAQLQQVDEKWRPLSQQRDAVTAQRKAAIGLALENTSTLENIWTKRFALIGLKGLSPEQLCWSILKATGQVRIQHAAALAAINKKSPLSEADQKDPAKVAARDAQAAAEARVKLQANVNTFVQLFAAAGGEPQGNFFATADQALFFRNGSQIRGWIAAGGDSLYQRLRKLTKPEEVAEEAYLAVLSRQPDPIEQASIVQYLQVPPAERDAALQEVVWALITSIEFRFRH